MGKLSEMAMLQEHEERSDGMDTFDEIEEVEEIETIEETEESDVKVVQNEDSDMDCVTTGSENSIDERKKEHECQEAQRKADWEAKQQERQKMEQTAWERVTAMDQDALMQASVNHVGTEVERITHRNMKLNIAEFIQTECFDNLELAKQVMHPRKKMVNCYRYITNQAAEYAKQEMNDNDITPGRGEWYGCDVPDDLCYEWAREYFLNMDAKEDKADDEEFVPKPYYGPTPSKKSKKPEKKSQVKLEKPQAKQEKLPKNNDTAQIVFWNTKAG